jgi:branched-chain amino acid transport system ATP-binding protein
MIEQPLAEGVSGPAGSATVIAVNDLHGWYGESHILQGITFEVREGEVVTLLGRNGAGKTTTLRAIMGILSRRTGSVALQDRETISLPPRAIARLGIGYCPEERAIFSSLTVEENLKLPPATRKGGLTMAAILEMFPNLAGRLSSPGTKLSGGEQQMLAIARILRTGSRILLLDEPTEGLAPVVVKQIGHTIALLKKAGFTILLVEQNLRFACAVADRHYAIELGRVVDTIANTEANFNTLTNYLKF